MSGGMRLGVAGFAARGLLQNIVAGARLASLRGAAIALGAIRPGHHQSSSDPRPDD